MLTIHLTPEQLREGFTHYGYAFGIVPVYVDMRDDEMPMMITRNWIPEILLALVEGVWALQQWVMSLIDPNYEPLYPVILTDEII